MGKGADGLGLLLMGKPKGKTEGEESELDDGGGEDESKTLAAEALIKAIGRKDASGVAAAFQQLLDCCDDDHESEVDEDV